MRVKKIKNIKIDSAFKDVGKQVTELDDKEYTKLEKLIKMMKDPNAVEDFNDDFDSKFFIAKIPESYPPIERIMKDGTARMSISVILADGNWANFLVEPDADEVTEVESHYGNNIAIVAKLTVKEKDGTTFRNIKGYRGSIILADANIDLD